MKYPAIFSALAIPALCAADNTELSQPVGMAGHLHFHCPLPIILNRNQTNL
jgi:hypothetical protein